MSLRTSVLNEILNGRRQRRSAKQQGRRVRTMNQIREDQRRAEQLESRMLLSATLTAGDIAIIGYNTVSTSGDDFAFVTLADIPAGEEIFFSDGNADGAGFGANNISDGAMSYTVPAGGMTAGTVVRVVANISSFTTAVGNHPGTLVASVEGAGIGDFAAANADELVTTPNSSYMTMTSSGDQLSVFQGSVASPNFIFAVNGDASVWLTFDPSDSNSTRVYPTV